MKHDWADEELIAQWTLSAADFTVLENKTEINRLGQAVLLKFFNLTARLPRAPTEVPTVAVSFIAKQLRSAPALWRQYEWDNRSFIRPPTGSSTFLWFPQNKDFRQRGGTRIFVPRCVAAPHQF